MKLFSVFIKLFSLKTLTFTSFSNELNEILKSENDQYKKNEEIADDKIYFAFIIDRKTMPFKSLNEFKKSLYGNLGIKDTEDSIAAIEHHDCSLYYSSYTKCLLKIFLNVIHTKIQKPEINLNDIYPRSYVGIITDNLIKKRQKKIFYSEKFENIATNIQQNCIHNIKKTDDDFLFDKSQEKISVCFFSNYNLSEFEYNYLVKLHETFNFEIIQEFESLCFVVIDLKNDNKKNFLKNFNKFLKHERNEKDELFYIKKIIHLNKKKIDTLSVFNETNCNNFYYNIQNIKKTINSLFHIELKIDTNITQKFFYETETFSFMIEKSEIASKELEKYMDINLINRIQKILSFKYRGFFQIHKINFYKICHEIIEKRNDEMFIFNKITVIVLFEIGSVIKKFEFFYYKNFDKSQLIDYDVENVEKSSKAFTNFLFNLKNFLNSKMCLFEDVNLHYSNFYSKNLITIDAYYSRITYYYFENDGSYIDLVKKMCEMVKKVNGEYNLYKFTSKSYKEFESLFLLFMNTMIKM